MKRVVGYIRAFAPAPLSGVLTITTASPLPGAYIWRAYSLQFAATGGVPPYSWSITSGALQQGLSLSASGLLSGTVTSTEFESFSVRVTDSVGGSQQSNFSLSILFDYYISVTGSDANPGTIASPWAITSLRPPSAQPGSNYNLLPNKSVGLLDGMYVTASMGPIGGIPSGYNNTRLQIPNGSPGTPTVVASVNQRKAIITGKTAGPYGTNAYNTDGVYTVLGMYTSGTIHDIVIQDLVVAGNLGQLILLRPATQGGNTNVVVCNNDVYDLTNWTGGAVNTAGIHLEGFLDGTHVYNNKVHDCYDVRAPNTFHGNSDCCYDYCQNSVFEMNTFYNAGAGIYQKVGLFSNPPQGATVRQNYTYALPLAGSSQWHYDGGDPSYEFNANINGANNYGLWVDPGGGVLPGGTTTSANFRSNSFVNSPWGKVTCVMDVTFFHNVGGGSEVHACTFTLNSPIVRWSDGALTQDCTLQFTATTRASAGNYQGGMPGALFGYTESPGTIPGSYNKLKIRNNINENVSFGGLVNATGYSNQLFTQPANIGDTSATLQNPWPYQDCHGWFQFNSGPEWHTGTGKGVTQGSTSISWNGGLAQAQTGVYLTGGADGRQSDTDCINNTFYFSTHADTVSTSACIQGLATVNPSVCSLKSYNNICDNGGTNYQQADGQVNYGGGIPMFGANPPAQWWSIIDFNIYNFQFVAPYSGVTLIPLTSGLAVSPPGPLMVVRYNTSLANWVANSSTWGPTADANTQQGSPQYQGVDGNGTMVRGGGAAQYKLKPGTLGTNGTASQGSMTGLVGGQGCDKGAWGPDENGNPVTQIGCNF